MKGNRLPSHEGSIGKGFGRQPSSLLEEGSHASGAHVMMRNS